MRKIRKRIFEIIFEADTFAGKTFDVVLLILILVSTAVVILESVPVFQKEYGSIFKYLEWIITILFSIEYLLRIYAVTKAAKYIFSFYGLVDFLSILPTYLGLVIVGSHSLMVIRALRLLRVFRIFKITHFTNEAQILMKALKASRYKIGVFLFTVLTLVLIIGTLMYLIEGEKNGFSSIPKSIYWAVVTLTTVGYGDLTPQTSLGQFISGFVMILGYAIIAVPTGIVTVEMSKAYKRNLNTRVCSSCAKEAHDNDAVFCKYCGKRLNEGNNPDNF